MCSDGGKYDNHKAQSVHTLHLIWNLHYPSFGALINSPDRDKLTDAGLYTILMEVFVLVLVY